MATWLKPQSNPLWESSSQALSNRLPLLKEGLALLWCSILAYTSRHREPSRSTAVGTVAIFVAVASTCYYWCILLVIPLEKRRWLNIAILLFNALLCILALTPAKSALYGIAAWLLFGIFIAWTVVLWRERKAPLQRKEP
jgi:FtsH-binding integral membrane protein